MIRVAVLPDQTEERLRERHEPLLEHLAEQTGWTFELYLPGSYKELVEGFGQRRWDLAYFGGVTFVRAAAAHGAVPLAMRDVDMKFTSTLITRKADSYHRISDLSGKRLSFGSRLSTSGHWMPRYYLKALYGIEPESYFSEVQYSGKHDLTALAGFLD